MFWDNKDDYDRDSLTESNQQRMWAQQFGETQRGNQPMPRSCLTVILGVLLIPTAIIVTAIQLI
jgi:hypothetical protein